jgi:hypothetical protein
VSLRRLFIESQMNFDKVDTIVWNTGHGDIDDEARRLGMQLSAGCDMGGDPIVVARGTTRQVNQILSFVRLSKTGGV